MTFTRVPPLPESNSFCKSGDILLVASDGGGWLAARALVLVEMNTAEQIETNRTAVTARLRTWGRIIPILRGVDSGTCAQNASTVLVLAPCQMRNFGICVDSVEESTRFERAFCRRFSQNDGGLSQRESFRSE